MEIYTVDYVSMSDLLGTDLNGLGGQIMEAWGTIGDNAFSLVSPAGLLETVEDLDDVDDADIELLKSRIEALPKDVYVDLDS